MSNFENRVTRARRQSMRRWARAFRYAGDLGMMLTGAAGLWFFAAVVLS